MNPVGQLRPSQLIYTFGVGALTDLPSLSVIIMGLDEWPSTPGVSLTEERLLSAVRAMLGQQVESLRLPPADWDADGFQPSAPGLGVPVAAFPRWLRCPRCGALGTVDRGIFQLKEDRFRPEQTCYVHSSCGQADKPKAVAMRFLRACQGGHLNDIDWDDFVHHGMPCPSGGGALRFQEAGGADEPSDLYIRCVACQQKPRVISEAFEKDRYNPPCPGFHPHLRRFDAVTCEEAARTIVLGASNLWFPIVLSVLSIPRNEDRVARLVDENWALLSSIESEATARFFLQLPQAISFMGIDPSALWAAIQSKRADAVLQQQSDSPEVRDLYTPEWESFTHPQDAPQTKDFRLREVPAPERYEHLILRTVLGEKLREVRALIGFNRVMSRGEFTEAEVAGDERRAPLSKHPETWVPAAEVRGEGIFLQFREEAVQAWLTSAEAKVREGEFREGHKQWRKFRRLQPPEAAFPGLRYVLLHSFAHALLRQVSIECGYASASIRERIYSRSPSEDKEAMAGVLLYTAASDSEGTLGGLVALGEPGTLARLIDGALSAAGLCGSDPLCAEHLPTIDEKTLHGACCHACLFTSETSCERGNRFLDRAVISTTYLDSTLSYFS